MTIFVLHSAKVFVPNLQGNTGVKSMPNVFKFVEEGNLQNVHNFEPHPGSPSGPAQNPGGRGESYRVV